MRRQQQRISVQRGWTILARAVAVATTTTIASALLQGPAARAAYTASQTFDLNTFYSVPPGEADGILGNSIVGGTSAGDANVWYGGRAVDVTPGAGYSDSDLLATDGVQYAGQARANSDSSIHAMVWQASGGQPVDLYPGPSYQLSYASAVSNNQQVGTAIVLSSQRNHAVMWTGTSASFADLNPTGFYASEALATNGTQQGGYAVVSDGSEAQAIVWNGSAGSYTLLNPAGYTGSTISGMSGVLEAGTADGPSTSGKAHAALWRGTDGTFTDLNPAGYSLSFAMATNNSVQVGWGKDSGGRSNALVWTQSSFSYQNISGLVPGGASSSEATSVDPYGNILGFAKIGLQTHDVVWYAGDMLVGTTTQWNQSTNWMSGIPAAGNDVLCTVANPSPQTITFTSSGLTYNTVTVDNAGGATMTFNLNGGTLSSVAEFVGVVGQGVVAHTAGTNTVSGTLELGSQAGGVGQYQLSGAGSLLTTQNEELGYTGSALFTQTGGTHNVGGLDMSRGGSSTYLLSGGTLVVGSETIGGNGNGTFIQTGGTHSIAGNAFIGSGLIGSGTFQLSGTGVVNAAGDIYIGGIQFSGYGKGEIDVTGGSMNIAGTLKVWNASGSNVKLSAGTLSVGSLDTDSNPASFQWTGGTFVLTGAPASVGSGTALGTSVVLAPAMTLRIRDNATSLHIASSGSLGFTGGQLDLTSQKLISSSSAANPVGSWNGSSYTGLTGQIASGRNGGNWNGAGIITSQSAALHSNYTTLAIARASDVKPATATATALWSGQTITGTDTLVMYTYGGDATLDGKINVDDYIKIDSGIAAGLTGWSNGDFNYDGKVNIDDYTQFIDANIGTQGAPFPAAGGSGTIEGISVSAVPEPGPVGMMLLCGTVAGAALSRRSRRGRRFADGASA